MKIQHQGYMLPILQEIILSTNKNKWELLQEKLDEIIQNQTHQQQLQQSMQEQKKRQQTENQKSLDNSKENQQMKKQFSKYWLIDYGQQKKSLLKLISKELFYESQRQKQELKQRKQEFPQNQPNFKDSQQYHQHQNQQQQQHQRKQNNGQSISHLKHHQSNHNHNLHNPLNHHHNHHNPHHYHHSNRYHQLVDSSNQQSILKVIAKGFILPQLNYSQDIEIIRRVIQKSLNKKYLFMIWQQSLFQIKQLYQANHMNINDDYDIINLKLLSISSIFIHLISQPIFVDVKNKIIEFYQCFEKLDNQSNLIEESQKSQKQAKEKFICSWFQETLSIIQQWLSQIQETQSFKQHKHKQQQNLAFTEQIEYKIKNNPFHKLKSLKQSAKTIHKAKQQQSSIIQLFKKFYSKHSSNQLFSKRIQNIFNLFIFNMDITLSQGLSLQSQSRIMRSDLKQKQQSSIIIEFPLFWITDNLHTFNQIYEKQYLFYVLSKILMSQLPKKPQFTKFQPHSILLLKFICEFLYFKPGPIKSLSLLGDKCFYINLFQTLSIVVGILNTNANNTAKLNEKQLHSIISAIFNKKQLFSSPLLLQIIWSTLILRHQDINYRNFCIGQYKRVFTFTIKQLSQTNSIISILKNGRTLLTLLLKQLNGNSNPQHIGYHITLAVYYLACLKKIYVKLSDKINTGNSNNDQAINLNTASITGKSQSFKLLFNYVFSESIVLNIKSQLKDKLYKLKQTLKDRLEVQKMKNTNANQNMNEHKLKENNEIGICIYRIEEQINFQW